VTGAGSSYGVALGEVRLADGEGDTLAPGLGLDVGDVAGPSASLSASAAWARARIIVLAAAAVWT
jgi:hypothetical protein